MRCLTFLLALAIIFTANNICYGSETALQKAWVDYLRGDYKRAIGACRKISRSKILGEEGRYIMGLSFLKLGDYHEARKNFEFVLENYPKPKREQELLLGIADSFYLEGSFKKAEEYYIRLLKSFSGTDCASIVYLGLGKSQRKQGKWQEAKSSFYKVVRDFPLSLEAETAKDYLRKKRGYFSIQVGAFSRKGNAQKLSKLLKKKGYNAYIEKIYKRDRLIYRVKVGKFDTKKGAQREAAKLKKEGLTVKICT